MRYFCIEERLLSMTERNYKKLCKLYPYTKVGSEIVEDEFDTGVENPFYYDKFSKKIDLHQNCLEWIEENSKILIPYVRVLNY